MAYTPSQQRVIDHDEGHIQVIACAGSGKTDTITRRVARLLSKGAEPKSMVAFTFTEKAAEEMKYRIRKHLVELSPVNPELGEMYVGTIHSFCFELLNNYFPQFMSYDVLDEHTRVLFLMKYEIFHEIGLDRLGEHSYKDIAKFCFNADIVREEMLDPERLTEEFRTAYLNYIQLLERKKYIDFSGMMHHVLRLLEENSTFREAIQERFRFITVDEYQDINPIQERIIQLMVGNEGNLCVVGDDDQCIYQWRGTNVDNILTFLARYAEHGVKKEDVTTNFRSTEAIVKSARKVIEANKRLEKDVVHWKEGRLKYEKGDIYKVSFPSWEDEVRWIADKIEELRGKKYVNNKGGEFSLDYRDMAVFYRSVRTSAGPLIDELKRRDIPFIVKGGGKLFEAPEVELVLMSMHFLAGLNYKTPSSPSGEPAIEITTDILRHKFAEVFGGAGDPTFFVEQLEDKRDSLDENVYVDFQEILHLIVMYMGATTREFEETVLYNLGRFSEVVSDFQKVYGIVKFRSMKYLFGYVNGHAQLNYDEGGMDDPTRVNAIKIMTIHTAKGLQFPVVFVSDLIKGRFPSEGYHPDPWYIPRNLFDADRYDGTYEDERRLFYVAITRSEKFLFLTASQRVPSTSQNPRLRTPSQFWMEFPDDYAILDLNLPDPTKRESLPLQRAEPLRGFPTSYSELRYYDWCPYNYQLRTIYGFNPNLDMALGYGKCIHNILNILHTRYKDKSPTEEEVLDVVDENFYMRYAPHQFAVRFKDAAEKVVKTYVDRFCGDFHRILETEKSFEFILGDALISGAIDLIKTVDDQGNLRGIEIVDFKNREAGEFTVDHEKQLKLYAIASLRALGLDPKKAIVHHLDDNSLSEVDISLGALKKTENEVSETVTKILNRQFPKTTDKTNCRKCDYQYLCTKR